MAKRKRGKKVKANINQKSGNSSRKIWRSFYTFLFSLVISFIFFIVQTFLNSEIWVVTFVMLGLLFLVISLAFLITWLILLVMRVMRR